MKIQTKEYPARDYQDIIAYYSEAGSDYRAWSPSYHMHFGYWNFLRNPLRREKMLREMNNQVFQLLFQGKNSAPASVIDLGCGVGASSRQLAENHSGLEITAVSIVPWQLELAEKLTESSIPNRIQFRKMDYTALDFPDRSFDAAYAIESSCYASGLSKMDFLQEASRVLKPGARLVVADGFLKKGAEFKRPLRGIVNRILKGWSLETFADIRYFTAAMAEAGFVNIRVRDISWRIAPSVLHVPWVCARFLLRSLIRREKLSEIRRNNVWAPFLAPLLGMARRRFGYYLVSAEKT